MHGHYNNNSSLFYIIRVFIAILSILALKDAIVSCFARMQNYIAPSLHVRNLYFACPRKTTSKIWERAVISLPSNIYCVSIMGWLCLLSLKTGICLKYSVSLKIGVNLPSYILCQYKDWSEVDWLEPSALCSSFLERSARHSDVP